MKKIVLMAALVTSLLALETYADDMVHSTFQTSTTISDGLPHVAPKKAEPALVTMVMSPIRGLTALILGIGSSVVTPTKPLPLPELFAAEPAGKSAFSAKSRRARFLSQD